MIVIKEYPYGFNSWMCNLWKIGQEMKMWNYSVTEYKSKLCFRSWLVYFNMGLHPKDAIQMDLAEQD